MGIVPNPETQGKNYLGYANDPWEKVYASEINDVQAEAYKIAASRSWQPAKAYEEGDMCFPSIDNGKSFMLLECIVAGTTSTTEPVWGNVTETQVDGGVTWLIKKLGSGEGGSGLSIGMTIQHLGTVPPDGFLALNGAEVGRNTYPELWDWVQNKSGLLVGEANWQTAYNLNSGNCGSYSDGDGATTFRLPNITGFLRPQGNSIRNVGEFQGDAIRNIEGSFNTFSNNVASGVFEKQFISAAAVIGSAGSVLYNVDFNASQVVPTAEENRPKSIAVLFCVKAFDNAQNQGTVDITELANDVATNASKINVIDNVIDNILENNIGFTIIYPNGGTTENPANVTAGQRIVMDNPFPSYHVFCQAQLLCGGEWGSSDFIYSQGGIGVRASQLLPDDKIIIQTGYAYIRSQGSINDGGTWSNAIDYVTAPCRILVNKLGAIT